MAHNISECNYMNQVLWTDVHPYEIVERCTESRMKIRAMDHKLSENSPKPVFYPGGFVGHYEGQEKMKYDYTPNESYPIVTIRRHKDGQWRCPGGNRYLPSVEPRYFRDMNF